MNYTAYELILTAIESQDDEAISRASEKLIEAGKEAEKSLVQLFMKC